MEILIIPAIIVGVIILAYFLMSIAEATSAEPDSDPAVESDTQPRG